ncbi:DMT family transporter [Rubritalea marina]|uniref:DMT family transporter n=1 Tax=Rubritalea marina TaxID=361055 RepID=UPI000368A33B|nr:DMT family transporter [Rubritalea marina]
MSSSRYLVFLPVMLCALLWGSAFPCIKLVYQHWGELGVEVQLTDRWFFAGIRFAVGGGALLLLAKNPWREWKQTPKKHLMGLSLGQTFFQYIFFYLGLSLSGGALSALMASTGSFWWMILAPLILGVAWPNVRQWMVLLVGALGVAVAVYAPGASGGDSWVGALCIIVSTMFGSIGMVLFSKVKPTMGARAATGYSLFLGGLALMVLAVDSWPRVSLLFDAYVLMLTSWLAVVSAVGFAVWNHLTTIYPVPLLASCRFIIPICGMVQSLVFLEGEVMTWGLWLGGALVVGSTLLATWMSSERKRG